MDLILWRHADAEAGMSDAKRELTAKGRRQAARVARWLRPRLEGDWVILVSPAERARQTADALGLAYDVRAALGTQAADADLLREAGWPAGPRNVVLVGHQPTLGHVAARLLTGRAGDFAVRKGALWWFAEKRDRLSGASQTFLRAVIAPDVVD